MSVPLSAIPGEGTVIGAISVSGPSYRLGAGSFPELAARVRAGADEISLQLGYFRPS